MAGFIAAVYGIGAYATFLITILYAIGFVGGLVLPMTINSGSAGPLMESVVIDIVLLSAFAIQHSVMAREGFKRWWTRFVPKPVERSTYVLVASAILLLLFWQWRPITEPVWTVTNPVAIKFLATLYWGAGHWCFSAPS